MNVNYYIIFLILGILSLSLSSFYQYDQCNHSEKLSVEPKTNFNTQQLDSIFYMNPDLVSDGFDFPVGKPNASNYYVASRFGERNHLGEDWNGKGGGNSDLGDPVYAVADGVINFSQEVCCGWGNVIRLVHKIEGDPEKKYIESVYAHLQRIDISAGQKVRRGDLIGTIGTANGTYKAHLHLEIRDFINMALGPGYSQDHFGYLDPSTFIHANRP